MVKGVRRLRGPWSLSTAPGSRDRDEDREPGLIISLWYADQVRERRASELLTATRSARNGAAIVEGFLRDLEDTTFAMTGLLAGTTVP
jgi:hypothetical protein